MRHRRLVTDALARDNVSSSAQMTPTRSLDAYDEDMSPMLSTDLRGDGGRREGSLFISTPPPVPPPQQRRAPQQREQDLYNDTANDQPHRHRRSVGQRTPNTASATSTTLLYDRVEASLFEIQRVATFRLVQRVFFQWALWADRRVKVEALSHRVRLQSSLTLAQRFYGAWARRARASLAWAANYGRAEALQQANALPLLRAYFAPWWTSTVVARELHAVASRLRDRILQSLALRYFTTWRRRRRRTTQQVAVRHLVVEHSHVLGLRYFMTWQARGIRQVLLKSLLSKTERVVRRDVMSRWRQFAQKKLALRVIAQESLVVLARGYLGKWQRWQARHRAASALATVNACRALLPLFTEWAWEAQLEVLRYDRHVRMHGLPEIS